MNCFNKNAYFLIILGENSTNVYKKQQSAKLCPVLMSSIPNFHFL